MDSYLEYLRSVRRFSARTVDIYAGVLSDFKDFTQTDYPESLNHQAIRAYEAHLLSEKGDSARTANLHLSVLSGFCKYLLKQGRIESNPVRLTPRPKVEKRLPVFYRDESMNEYFRINSGVMEVGAYPKQLDYMIISTLFNTGMRRSELISVNRKNLDLSRKVLRVLGKGDKMREIPLTDAFCNEISLYLHQVDSLKGCDSSQEAPLLQSQKGNRLYPVFIDRAVKRELSGIYGITCRKSPHVLRHTLATELLDNGSDLNSIKELLGHSSLAATQVYTHNSIERLKSVYNNAHPRAKIGGKNGNQD